MLIAGGLAAAPAAAQTTLTRVSVDSGGAQGNDISDRPSISADGRYVAFASRATNLMANDNNGSYDIFVKDLQTATVTRVSVKTDGTEMAGDSLSPSISADGRFVTFASSAALVPDDTNAPCAATGYTVQPTCPDIYVHDRTTGETTRVSVATAGTQADGESKTPSISADGRYVVFASSATTLVASDTNGKSDVFVRDRTTNTTTRVSVSTGGAQGDGDSFGPTMSDDGSVIAFVSKSTTLDTAPDTLGCSDAAGQCMRLYVRTVSSGVTARAAITEPPTYDRPNASAVVASGTDGASPVMSRDGKTIAFELISAFGPIPRNGLSPVAYDLSVYTLANQHTRLVDVSTTQAGNPSRFFVAAALDAVGHTVAWCFDEPSATNASYLMYRDLVTGGGGRVPQNNALASMSCGSIALSGNGTQVAFATDNATLVSGDTNNALDVFVLDRDPDHDGIPSEWETLFGLNPNNPIDAAQDPDGDGKTNLQEYLAGTHPLGTLKRYLAEGAHNQFFSTIIHIYNPSEIAALIELHYLGDSGVVGTDLVSVGPHEMTNVVNPPNAPDASFSTVVESNQLIAVERTMTWAGGGLGSGYGSSAETAILNPATTWYFAEGATHGAFDLFYLLQNPNDTDAMVTITYLLPAGQAPIVLTYQVAANSRRTIWVDQEPGLGATDVSAKIDSTLPIFAERSMYLSTPNQPFAGGTSGAGIAVPATQWFVAEGATGGFFDLFYLIGNPSTQDASVTVSYLLPDGTTFDKVYPVAAQSRLTIGVDGEDPRLAGTSVSARITSTNSVPIVVERSMWWPSPNWYEGSLTAATTDTSGAWALAGGYVDAVHPEDDTYLLVANPSATATNVRFQLVGLLPGLLRPGESSPRCDQTVQVAAQSRYTTGIKALCGGVFSLLGVSVGGTITSDAANIVIERSTYWSTPDQFWAAGASTLLTKLQ